MKFIKLLEQSLKPSSLVRDAYVDMFPTDDLGLELDPKITFSKLYTGMCRGKDVYDLIGVGDSVIRERIFEMLSKIYQVDYDVIYNTWLNKGSELNPRSRVMHAYRIQYPDDDLGAEIDPRLTFEKLYTGMKKHKDVYDLIGVGDSVIRERIFEMMSKIYRVPYNDIYDMWIAH